MARRSVVVDGDGPPSGDAWPVEWTCGVATIVFFVAFFASGQIMPWSKSACTSEHGMCTPGSCECIDSQFRREMITQDGLTCFQCIDEFCPAVPEGDPTCSSSKCECEDSTWPRREVSTDGTGCWQCVHPAVDLSIRQRGAPESACLVKNVDSQLVPAAAESSSDDCAVFRFNGVKMMDKRDSASCVTRTPENLWRLTSCTDRGNESRFQQRATSETDAAEIFCVGEGDDAFCVEPSEYMCTLDVSQCTMGPCRCEDPTWVRQELRTSNGSVCFTCAAPVDANSSSESAADGEQPSSLNGRPRQTSDGRRRSSNGGSSLSSAFSTVFLSILSMVVGLAIGCRIHRLWTPDETKTSPSRGRRKAAAAMAALAKRTTWSERLAEQLEQMLAGPWAALCAVAEAFAGRFGYIGTILCNWLDALDDALEPLYCVLDVLQEKTVDAFESARAKLMNEKVAESKEVASELDAKRAHDTRPTLTKTPESFKSEVRSTRPLGIVESGNDGIRATPASAGLFARAVASMDGVLPEDLEYDPLNLTNGSKPLTEPALEIQRDIMMKLLPPGFQNFRQPAAAAAASSSSAPNETSQKAQALRQKLEKRKAAAATSAAAAAEAEPTAAAETQAAPDDSWIEEIEQEEQKKQKKAAQKKAEEEAKAAQKKEKKSAQKAKKGKPGADESKESKVATEEPAEAEEEPDAAVAEPAQKSASSKKKVKSANIAPSNLDDPSVEVDDGWAEVSARKPTSPHSNEVIAEPQRLLEEAERGLSKLAEVDKERATNKSLVVSTKTEASSTSAVDAKAEEKPISDAWRTRNRAKPEEKTEKEQSIKDPAAEKKTKVKASKKAAADDVAVVVDKKVAEKTPKVPKQPKVVKQPVESAKPADNKKTTEIGTKEGKLTKEAKDVVEPKASKEAEVDPSEINIEKKTETPKPKKTWGLPPSSPQSNVENTDFPDIGVSKEKGNCALDTPDISAEDEEKPEDETAQADSAFNFTADAPEFVPFSMMQSQTMDEDVLRGNPTNRLGRKGRRLPPAGGPDTPDPAPSEVQEALAPQSGNDEITTMMISGIPAHHNSESFRAQLDAWGLQGTYNFFYMPKDRDDVLGVGYAFINFLDSSFASLCQWLFQQCPFEGVVSPFHIHGLENNVAHWDQFVDAEDVANAPLILPMATPSQWAINGVNNMFNSKVTPQIREQFLKTKLCVFYKKNKCALGSSCPFAHSKDELQAPPDLAKTKLCYNFFRRKCKDTRCKFAHGYEELRATNNVYKTELCRWWSRGSCKAGSSCRYAHGVDELRRNEGFSGMAEGTWEIPAEDFDAMEVGVGQGNFMDKAASKEFNPGNMYFGYPQTDMAGQLGMPKSAIGKDGMMDADSVDDAASDMALSDVSTLLGADHVMMRRQQTAPPTACAWPVPEEDDEDNTVVLRVKRTFMEAMSAEEPPMVALRRSWSDGDLPQLRDVFDGMVEFDDGL